MKQAQIGAPSASASAATTAASWFGPPAPKPPLPSDTVASPPQPTRTQGAETGPMPPAQLSASSASSRPTTLASPSSSVETTCAATPALRAAAAIASQALAPVTSSTVCGSESSRGE